MQMLQRIVSQPNLTCRDRDVGGSVSATFWSKVSKQLLDAMKLGTHIHVPFRMNCSKFGDPLTFYLVPLSGKIVTLSHTLVYYKIPAKLHSHQPQLYKVLRAY